MRNLHPLAESVSFERGALLEPPGVELAVAAMSGVRVGSTAAVLGAGRADCWCSGGTRN